MWTDDLDLLTDRELFVVRWRNPRVESAHGLKQVILRHYEEVATPLFFAAIVGPDCPPPDMPAREALLRGHDQIYDCCRTVRMAVIGVNIRQTVMRSVITTMTIAAGLRGKAFSVDKTIPDMVGVAEQMLGRDPRTLRQQLLDAGLATPAEFEL